MDGGGVPSEIGDDVSVNMGELAHAFDVSTTTIQDWLKIDGFPVAEAGGNGKPYRFNLADVRRWRQERQGLEAKQEARKREAINQLRLEITGGSAGDDLPTQLSAVDRIREYEAQAKWMAMARQRRELISARDVQICLEKLLLQIGSVFEGLPDQFGDELGLTKEQQEAVAMICDRKRRDIRDAFINFAASEDVEAA